jgi:hypothetical protein
MSFRWFIYYCTVGGGCAAYLGWLMGRIPRIPHAVFQAAIRGMFLGLVLAVGLTLVDALWNQSSRSSAEGMWRVLIAGLVGGIGGFLGGMLGQVLYGLTQLSLCLLIGWGCTGLLIGLAPGMYDLLARLAANEELGGSRRKVLNGLIGGSLGGLLGGLLYLGLRGLWGLALEERTDEFWSPSATGFVALGLCVGLLIGLAQVILREAWVRVEAGFRAGRELLLTRPEIIIGRGEGCDIALFGDSEVEKQHARILLRNGRYLLEDLDSPGGTYLNGERIDGQVALRGGDLIEVGRACLRFGERERQAEEE